MRDNHKLVIVFLVVFIIQLANAQWTQVANLPGNTRINASSFVIGNTAYVIGGANSATFKDVWEYNITTNIWTQKAFFIGIARSNAVAFSINGKGYYGLGVTSLGGYLADLWEYDPINDSWTQKASLTSLSRMSAVGFSIGSKAYVGAGTAYNNGNNTSVYYSDFWEYNPLNNSWAQKANIPGSGRSGAVGMELNNKGYVGLGKNTNLNTTFSDFYEYDPTNNTWVIKQSTPGQGRESSLTFRLGGELLVVGGNDLSPTAINSYSTCMKYNPTSNTWANASNFLGGTITNGVAVSFSNTAFIGIGYNPTLFQTNNEWWQYIPSTTDIPFNSFQNSEVQIYPNPANDAFHISICKEEKSYLLELQDLTGRIIKSYSIENNTTINVKELTIGLYTYTIKSKSANQVIKKGKIAINH